MKLSETAMEDDDLDRYLDTMMLDMTMSIAEAKKAGDLVQHYFTIRIISLTSTQLERKTVLSLRVYHQKNKTNL